MKKIGGKSSPRVLVVLTGDIGNDPEVYIKYKTFNNALGWRFQFQFTRSASYIECNIGLASELAYVESAHGPTDYTLITDGFI